jgi:acyl-coenzyme A synthetase/AMP-(fatty) acid ligase
MMLRDFLFETAGRTLSDPRWVVAMSDIRGGTILGGRAAELAGRSVLVAMADQLTTALAMFELDGLARRMLLCPPDLRTEHVGSVMADASIDAVVCDQPSLWSEFNVPLVVSGSLPLRPANPLPASHATEWLLLTSGTTGAPKVVSHSLEGLTGAITAEGAAKGPPPVWATFYDMRRYGGLQIFLRAVVGGGSMVLSDPKESIGDHLNRLIRMGVTHISGTPSHWRKALMTSGIASFHPNYVRLSGEIADQAVLDALRKAFPDSSIGHAFASTEAGVGFAVNDGLEGFPASFLGKTAGGVEMKVEDGSLRIRSSRTAHGYVGRNTAALADCDGFIDTGDMIELRGDRYYFVGRRGGIINVGGLKVHPEEVEAIINRHQGVRMSRVRSRKSPVTGAIVVADVVLADGTNQGQAQAIRNDIIADCRQSLAPHKVPAMITFVPSLDVTEAGKLARTSA